MGIKPSSEYTKELRERLASDERRLLSNIIDYANQKAIPYIFIAGDLFDSNKVKASLVSFVVSEFEKYKGKIFIAAGNHDYYSEDSVYATTDFPENVHIFTDEITAVETEDFIIYGYGFSAPHKNEDSFKDFKAVKKGKPEILITHTDFNTNSFYNPINLANVEASGLSYIAAGHIHIREEAVKRGATCVSYCGSPQNLRFKEAGKAQIIVGEFFDGFLEITKEDLSCHSYRSISADISQAESEEDIISICARALSASNPENTLFNLKIEGSLKDEIDFDIKRVTERLSEICLYLRAEEAYTVKYNINLIREESSVRGEFVRQALAVCGQEDEAFVEKVIEKGMKYL